MTNIIKIKRTSTPSSTPASLEHGELAINYSDGKIFYKNSSNQITQFSSGQKITSSTTAPASPASGDLWFESDTAKTFIYYDSFWVEICGALVAASSDGTTTLTTKGDLLSRSSGGLARLGVGTNGYFLKANSATATGLEWGAIPTVSILDDVGDVIITSATSGDILKWNGSNWVNDSALLAAKAPLASPTFTGTVAGITATMVGLGSVDNTSDTAKPVSTAQQTALDLKANLASPTFTGTVTIPSGASISGFAPLASPALTGTPTAPLAVTTTNTTQVATTSFVQQEITALIGGAPTALNTLTELAAAINNDASYASTLTTALALKAPLASPTFTGTVTIPSGASISGFAPLASPTFTGTVSGITATMVGLGNVDNTADTAKPVSTAQQTALNLKADLASPTLTGTPIAPTAAGGTNTTQIATTAFVTTAVSGATITSLDDVADVTITSNSSGHFLKWNGTAWVNDAIDLGTDTTGSYVTSLVAGTGVTLAGNSGEGATPTVTVDTTVIQARVANVTDTEIGYLDGVTSAIQTQIDTKLASSTAGTTYAPLASPTFTGTVTIPTGASITAPTGLVKGDVGLGNVDNTSDANKPVSTAQQTALDLKANLASPTFTGTTTLNDATVSGNLIVSGTTTSINTETLTVDDNIIILNNNATGAPSQDAGIEIERGTSTNVQIRWNETTDKWQFTNDGTTYNDLGAGGATISDTPPASPVTGQLWYESDTGLAYVYYDSFWVEIGGGSAYDTVINTIQAKGDLLAGTASQTLDRLTVGTNNQRLIANSSATTGLAWANDTTNTVIDTKGDLLVGATADVVAKLPVGTDNQVLVADSTATNGVSWMTSITKGSHSNIYSNSASITSATIVSASRTYNNRQYLFSNLTFNMPTNANTDITDWTAPANSSTYKWSYIYIRPSDNKFFLSDTAPAAGLNYRTIGGVVCLYLFPAYTSSIYMLNFQLDSSRYSCEQPYNARSTYRTFETGVQLNYDWGSGNRTTGTHDATSKIPTSATDLYIGFRNSFGWRADSANTYGYSTSMEVQNKSATWTTVYLDDGFMYCKTPSSGGGYYLRTIGKTSELTLSTNTYNFAATRMTWSHDACTGDADTGAGFWLKGFNDGNIF